MQKRHKEMTRVYDNYLAHYGILGQKWGIRRYQPYSVRGRKSGKSGRMIGEAAEANKEKPNYREMADRAFTPSIKNGKDKPNISPSEKIVKEGEKIAKKAKKVKDVGKPRESKTLSDAELKKRIERLRLEKDYETLRDEDIERGKITVSDVLETAGSVLAIAAAVKVIVSK